MTDRPRQDSPEGDATGVDRRRQAIVLAAYRSLAEHGFEGLRTRDIAVRVGLNHATLHYYFPTKEALVRAVVDHIGGVFSALHDAPDERATTATDPVADLRFHIGVILTQMERTPELFVVINELRLRALRDAGVRDILGRCDGRWRATLVRILAAGRASGHFRPDLDPERMAEVVAAFLLGLSVRSALCPEDSAREAREGAAATLVACLTGGRVGR